ncbi:putative ankyrin repeat protein [Eutypa lata UCREL1]|uniref:Putative ankyrin repeat protein n=1 Tax=Eutypa lata (strain UCR-EL1) TaxID=1287681 RepID=M7SJ94_EUTLA|nr:putative ankyrin repeat protein [Eutypa lata UCREL1]
MASQASVATSQPDQRHLRLIAAAAQGNEARVHDILAEELSWTSSVDQDILRQALQKVAIRGNLSIVRLLIQHGAGVNAQRANEVSALVKAAEGGHISVVSELLGHHADPNCRDRSGKTALFAACQKGYDEVVQLLLAAGADVEAHDKEGRTPLLFLASEKQGKWKWTINTIKLLLDHKAQIEVKDQIGRTPLLWAATNSNVELVRALLASKANVHACNNRGRTALHLAAAETNHREHLEDMVRLLLGSGADPCLPSDGGWTPLHNASQSGNANIVAILLQTRADANAQLTNGMTPLHWAASNGFKYIVSLLLSKPETDLSIKDSFDRTPMLCAAQEGNTEIVELLSPARAADRLSPTAKAACEAFEATVVDFGDFEKKQLVSKHSVYDLLYGWDEENDKPTIPTLTKNIKYKPDFRWIHLPANNVR